MPLHAASRGFGDAANGLEADMRRTKVQRHKPAFGSRQPAACSITRLNASVITQKYENRRKLLQMIGALQAIFKARCQSTNVNSANQGNLLEIRVFKMSCFLPWSRTAAALSAQRSAIPSPALTSSTLHTRRHTAGCRPTGSHKRHSGQPTTSHSTPPPPLPKR
jgi:hypothetical protein